MDRPRCLASDIMVATEQESTMEGRQSQQQRHPGPSCPTTPEAGPARESYKSCTFCAKRKRACDSQRPRCSLCIEKNQPNCHYPLKPLTKRAVAKHAAALRRPSSFSCSSSSYGFCFTSRCANEVKRRAEAPQTGSNGTGGVLAAIDTRGMPVLQGYLSLKRCRLSASPATGLLGMQENGFLRDFFGCFGILPLTTESTVRNAMVTVLTGAVASRQCRTQDCFGNGGSDKKSGAQVGIRLAEGEEEGCSGGGALAGRDTLPDNPAMCMLWCAIALGALMRGMPVEHVARYIHLARESLAECFEGRSIEHARAYLIMAFLHGVIRDKDKCESYLSFAVNIVTKLSPEDVPKEFGLMLMITNKMRVTLHIARHRVVGDDLSACCNNAVELPQGGLVRQAQNVLAQRDVCSMVLAADRRMTQAFVADMTSARAFQYLENREPVLRGEFRRGREGGGVMQEGDEQVRGAGTKGVACEEEELANRVHREPDVPPAGAAMKGFIRQALPDLTSVAKMLDRSNTCSGVAGLLYHGNVSYMQAIAGNQVETLESLDACVNVVLRYPGITRFRPHLIHCMLAAGHFFNRRDMYDAMRGVYNSVLPMGYSQAPPYEEWRSVSQVCGNILCRSLEAQALQRRDKEGPLHSNPVADGLATSGLSSGLMESPYRGAETRSSGSPPAPATAAGATAVPSVLPETPHAGRRVSQDGVGDDDAAADAAGHMRRKPGLAAMLIPESACPEEASEAGGVREGWSLPTAPGQHLRSGGDTVAENAAAAAAAAAAAHTHTVEPVEEDVVLWGREMTLTDADLLDAAAVFARDEGLLLGEGL